MKTVFYSKDAQFELTDDEFVKVMKEFDKNNRVFLTRLNVSLSPYYLWAGEKPEDKNRIDLGSAGYAIKKGGEWISERTGAKVDLKYFKKLKK